MRRTSFFRLLVVGVLCCLAMPFAVASAQRLSSPTFDLAAQLWGGRAKDRFFANDGGFALDAVVTSRARERSRLALVVGAGVAADGVAAFNDKCTIPVPPAVTRVCTPDFPSFSSLTALGGVEGRYGLIARVLVGPAVFHSGGRGTAAGLQGRADLSTPALVHISLVVSARTAWIPNFEGHAHQTKAVGLGFRIH